MTKMMLKFVFCTQKKNFLVGILKISLGISKIIFLVKLLLKKKLFISHLLGFRTKPNKLLFKFSMKFSKFPLRYFLFI